MTNRRIIILFYCHYEDEDDEDSDGDQYIMRSLSLYRHSPGAKKMLRMGRRSEKSEK